MSRADSIRRSWAERQEREWAEEARKAPPLSAEQEILLDRYRAGDKSRAEEGIVRYSSLLNAAYPPTE